ncbi:VOC family protein [Hyphococcus luteus]|uniref:Biphenyl 2,3-dioxygenase n=1 Tax=Hyphococcus luteus TaxID=2058213 RepID=A0A2S7K1L8_9PROT|nr:VOC family protein [Marinicaulis flavus]PQA86400.1 biphenyl 2,3-dioxygenase [Marinicaulis flavus]
MSGAPILGLGYVGVQTASLETWRDFGTGLLGLQPVALSGKRLAFRMDDAAARLLLREGAREEPDFFGWEVRNRQALEALAARLEEHGRRVERLPSSLVEQRQVSDAISTCDPEGNRLEIFYGQYRADAPFRPGRPISGFRTGSLGMGHAVMNVKDMDSALFFYRDILGFRLSDYTLRPFKAYFFHVNARHHSLALIENERGGMHHLMMEVRGFDDMGQGYDLAQLDPDRVATTLGRHSNDHMTSFYVRTPSQFLIEYGWGGRDIDPDAWEAFEMTLGPSLWGHERDWLPEEMRDEARRLRLKAAADGVRADLFVASKSRA